MSSRTETLAARLTARLAQRAVERLPTSPGELALSKSTADEAARRRATSCATTPSSASSMLIDVWPASTIWITAATSGNTTGVHRHRFQPRRCKVPRRQRTNVEP